MVDHVVKLLGTHVLGLRQVPGQAWVEIARACAHGHTRRRRKAHAGVDRSSAANRRQARAIAEVSQDHPPLRGIVAGQASEFLHEKGIRQPVKSVALYALRLQATGDWQHPGHSRHIAVESGVEAHHLRQCRGACPKNINQRNLVGQVLRCVLAEAVQLSEQLRSHALGLPVVGASVNNAMTDRGDGVETNAMFQPIAKKIRRRALIQIANDARFLWLDGVADSKPGSSQTDAFDLAMQSAPGRVATLVKRELYAGRAAIDGQNAHVFLWRRIQNLMRFNRQVHNLIRFNRNALLTTDTELSAMAAPANTGESSKPKAG